MAELRPIAPAFVVPGPSGVAVRDRLKHLTPADEQVLRLVGAHLGALASADLKSRCADGLAHCAVTWAARKRELTAHSSARWAGAITKASHDQWALARRCQAGHIRDLHAAIAAITRHDAAAVAIGRRAQGHPIRRRTAPPPAHRSDEQGHGTVQAGPETRGREGPRPRIPGPRTRSVPPGHGAYAGDQNAQHRSERSAEHVPLMLSP